MRGQTGAQAEALGVHARRTFLRRAATAGTVAWAAPTILTMNAASAAQLTSPPPGDIDDISEDRAPAAIAAGQAAQAGGQLPRTGADIDILTAAGLTAAAGGGALLWWSAELEKQAAIEATAAEIH